jgi:hypothetical protein
VAAIRAFVLWVAAVRDDDVHLSVMTLGRIRTGI